MSEEKQSKLREGWRQAGERGRGARGRGKPPS